ncbi:Panacea domain-containing protein [Massilibacteroides vaginae]|uniref:Panacea domain-containing protein n=1 Tax=Massilibacteroides vaginae TaxID=1673718 RepID=UPI000A1C9754|nr:Panacea domain-containing protein [Massilibacteroides vaginae]
MALKPYIIYNEEQLNKIGNTAIYLAERIGYLSKTKLLKLFYILDEYSIQRGGIPFLDLTYKVWKYGPLSEEMFVDLSSSSPTQLKPYIKIENSYIKAKAKFNDDEFTDNDIELMDKVIELFGSKKSDELVAYTHRENSLWYNIAKEKNILKELQNGLISNTEFEIDLMDLLKHDPIKQSIYKSYKEFH